MCFRVSTSFTYIYMQIQNVGVRGCRVRISVGYRTETFDISFDEKKKTNRKKFVISIIR